MGLYLPPELAWLGWVAGGAWPEGDETEVWEVSDAYKTAGAALRKRIPDIEDAKRVAVSAYPEGTGGDKIAAMFDQLLTGDQSVEALADYMDQIADATFDFGTQIEAAKLMTIVSLIALAIEIAWAWMFPPTAPAVEAAETAATQFILRRLELWLQERILAKVLSVFGQRFANLSKGWVMKILEGAFISGGLNAAVQVGQIGAGHRKNFNWKEFGAAAAAGLGAPFGMGAANSINKFTTRFLGDKLEKPWVRAGNGALVGIGSSPVFGAFGGLGSALVTGDWAETFGNPHGWVGGAAHGGIVGGVKGLRGINGFGNRSFEINWNPPRDGSSGIPLGHGPSDHLTTHAENGGPNAPRGDDRDTTFDNSSAAGGRPESYGNGQDSPLRTHPVSSTSTHGSGGGSAGSNGSDRDSAGTNGSDRDSAGSNSSGGDGTGSNSSGRGGSDTGNSGINKQSPLVATNAYSDGESSGSSTSAQRGSSPGDQARPLGAGGSDGGSHSPSSSQTRSSDVGAGRNDSPGSSNQAGNSGNSSNSNGAPPPRTSPVNVPGDSRTAPVPGGSTDRTAPGTGGPRPTPGSDGSVRLDRPPTSQTSKGGIDTPSRSTTPDTNIVAGQSSRPPASVSEVSSVGSGQPPRSSVVSDVSSVGSGPSPRSSAVSDVSSVGSGQPARASAVSDVNSTGSGQPPRSSAISDAGSNGPGQPPRRSTEANPGGMPSPPRSSAPDPGATQSRPVVPNSASGDGAPPSPRSPVTQPGSSTPGQPARPIVPESRGSGQPPQRLSEPNSSGAGDTWQRPSTPEANAGGSTPNSRPTGEHGTDAPTSRPGRGLLPPAEHRPAPRASVPQERHSETNGQRGYDAVEFGGTGARAFDGDREHPNWTRNDRGEVLVTSPDGTEHVVDKDENIVLGRPDDPSLVRIRPDRSVEFLLNDGNAPVGQPSPRADAASAPGRDNEFGFGRGDGTRHTVLSDGSVRTESPDGSWTIVRRDGGAELRSPWGDRTRFEPDGTAIDSRPGDPTVVTTPDNTVHIVPNDRAGWERDGDGTVIATSPDGTRHVIAADGIMVVGRPGDPQLMKVGPDYAIAFVGPDGTGPASRPGAAGSSSRMGGAAAHGVQSPTFTRPERVSHTVLGDGSVRTMSPDDWTTTVKPDGAMELLSPTGDKTVTKADGTVVESGPGSPTVITGPDGTKQTVEDNGAVTVENSDGTRHVVFDSADVQGGGRTQHPDGTLMHHDLTGTLDFGLRDRIGGLDQDGPRKHGVIQMDRPDGTGFESSPTSVKVFDADGTTYERGPRGSVRVTAPNGLTESRSSDGPIELSNGASLERTPDGVRVVHTDGSVSEIGPRGVSFTDGDGAVRGIRPDGTAFVNDSSGTVREVRGDGAMRVIAPDETSWGSRPDGTTWTVDEENKVHVADPDGVVAPPIDPKRPYVDGADLTAKIKPRLLADDLPLPSGYRAPDAPGTEDWIPQGYENNEDQDGDGPPESDSHDRGSQEPGPDDRDSYDWGSRKPWSDHRDPSRSDVWGRRYPGPDDPGSSGPDERDLPNTGSGERGSPGSDDRGPDSIGSRGPGSHSERPPNAYPHNKNAGFKGPERPDIRPGTGPGGNDSGGPGTSSPRDEDNLGDAGDVGGDSGSSEDRQPPQPQQPSPAMLESLLRNLHAAEGMAPSPPSGSGTQGSPDSSRLGNSPQAPTPDNRGGIGSIAPNDVSNPSSGMTRPGESAGPARPDLSTLRGAFDELERARLADRGPDGSARQEISDQSGYPKGLGTGERPGALHDSGSQDGSSAPERRGTSEDGSGSDGPDVRSDSDRQPSTDRDREPKPVGEESNPARSDVEDQQRAPDPDGPARSPLAEGDPGTRGTGDQQGAPGAADQQGAPESGDQPGSPGHSPTHGSPNSPEQNGNSSPGGSGTQQPATPGRAPSMPMQDGHAPAGSSSPGTGPPPGAAAPATPPRTATGAPKKPRRDRKKPGKPRKTPKSMLMPSPFEAPEQRAGPDGTGADIPFALGLSTTESESDSTARSTTKTTRSTSDG
ncbi:WXG100-like domain-containing protein [Nocardia mexicana]|uniref:Outer membrane channel protein CpnT-like N-terminal domain-containing protein n=1 Tax=Nocardia mexicana TaxID=279262 RepID=A0A370HDL4_9NOCA|nr:hypothetical protein [Nocardia mexicana]RDI55327.1 hypothetical protein DFR68_101160 [Nocardia mexicana]